MNNYPEVRGGWMDETGNYLYRGKGMVPHV
jgi:hypothetical protein